MIATKRLTRRKLWRSAAAVCWFTQCHHGSSFSGAVHGFQLFRQRNSALAYQNHENPIDDELCVSPISPTDVLNLPETTQDSVPNEIVVLSVSGSVPNDKDEQEYWKVLWRETSLSMIAISISSLVCPSSFILSEGSSTLSTISIELFAAVATAVPMIYLLPMSHRDWRLRQDSLARMYGRDTHSVLFMGVLALHRAIQEEIFFRLLLCSFIGAVTGSPFLAIGISSALYCRQKGLEHFVEGVWLSGLLWSGTVGISSLILAHFWVHWHWNAICWKHVVTQLRYVEATTSKKAISTVPSSDLYRFFLAHDSRHCGKLSAHDMRRALEYASQGRIPRTICCDMIDVYHEFDYPEFEATLRVLHERGCMLSRAALEE